MRILKVLFYSAVNHPSACEPGIMINFDNSICSNCPFLSLNTNIALIYFFPLYTHVEWNFLFCVFYPAYFFLFHFLFFFPLHILLNSPISPHNIFFFLAQRKGAKNSQETAVPVALTNRELAVPSQWRSFLTFHEPNVA